MLAKRTACCLALQLAMRVREMQGALATAGVGGGGSRDTHQLCATIQAMCEVR